MTSSSDSRIRAQQRIGALESWGRTRNRTARTLPAREGLEASFLRKARENLGPAASESEIGQAAEALRKAHYLKMSLARWGKPAQAGTDAKAS